MTSAAMYLAIYAARCFQAGDGINVVNKGACRS